METICDVVVIGGAFSGAATALLLKRRRPETRVLIVEKAAEFDRKVGESTTEVSSCFLTRVLGLSTWLGHHQLAKQGLRLWFAREAGGAFDECVEMGARYNSRLSGFQVDRSTLDEHLLALAVAAGCELWRPAKIAALTLGRSGEASRAEVRVGVEVRSVVAKWVVDASGRAAVLARQLGLWQQNTAHPVNSMWARFSGVKDFDSYELRDRFPAWAAASRTSRAWATNHLMGLGWWCWIIPLKGGDTSVGLVYDTRLFTPPAGANIGERLRAHFQTHPVGREILADAQPLEGDQRAYSNLPYSCERVAGEGWVLVGDAAGFLDPLYSPGLDFCAFTSHAAHTLIARALDGSAAPDEVAQMNERFTFCFRSWFDAIYRDKYYYMGDAELMAAAFLLDIASYHLGPVWQVYREPAAEFDFPPFGGRPGRIAASLMRFYNARLAALARRKIAAGTYGHDNTGWRLLIPGFAPEPGVVKLFLRGLFRWFRAEWRNLFLRPVPASAPIAAPVREN
jgi:flavin-dependent dehydrogenase